MTAAALAFALAIARPAFGETAYPMLMSLRPVAVQAGQSAEVTISSRYSLEGSYKVQVSGQGVTADVVPSASDKKPAAEKLTVRFTAAPDAQPGVRDVRIATPRGASTVAQLVVVRDPVVAESDKNDSPDSAQQVTLPASLCGAIEKKEDVDYWKFQVAAGASLVFQVRSARLQDRIHDLQDHSDPILTLRNAAGVTIAASDNNSYYADPLLAHHFDQAGEYLLEVRDVRYEGNQYWEYCIEASDRPFVENVHPLAVAAGQPTELQLVGHQLPAEALQFAVPTGLAPGAALIDLPGNGTPLNPVPLWIAETAPAMESNEPNESPEKAQGIAVPGGINGRLAADGDVDYFSFEAKKGDALSFEIIARRRQSAMDSHLRILDEKGKQLAQNDDLKLGKRGSADSWEENWSAPADGKYVVEVRDVHLRGGPRFPYFLNVKRAEPYFELYLDTDKTQVSPGGCGVIFARIERKNGFDGEVQLHIDGLPHGVVASCGRILAGKGQDGCIVLEADHDAPLAMEQVTIRGTATHKLPDGSTRELTAVAVPYQETYQPGGGRGHWPVESHVVSVAGYGDLRGVYLSEYDITLKPGESKRIEVTIDRSPEFAANVTLDMTMRHLAGMFANTLPAGVTLDDKQAQSLLAGKATQGYLTITAAKDAPPAERQQAVVMAHVALNFVMKWTYTSRPVTITVAP